MVSARQKRQPVAKRNREEQVNHHPQADDLAAHLEVFERVRFPDPGGQQPALPLSTGFLVTTRSGLNT